MLNYDEIAEAIGTLENGETTFSAVERLAMLYIVNEHKKEQGRVNEYSYAPAPADSEFVTAVKSAPFDEILPILDEHFEAIKTLYPKEYRKVIRMIYDVVHK